MAESGRAMRPPSPRRPSAIAPGQLDSMSDQVQRDARRLESGMQLPPAARPPSASNRFPVSPRGASPLRVPSSPGSSEPMSPQQQQQPGSAATTDAMNAFLAQHMPVAVNNSLQAWCGANVQPMLVASVQQWCGANVQGMLQGALSEWCNTNAQPALAGFLTQWMTMNAAALLQQQLGAALQSLQQQNSELRDKVEALQKQLSQMQSQPQPQSRPNDPQRPTSNGEPAPFMPTLPFSVPEPAAAVATHPSSSPLQSYSPGSGPGKISGTGLGIKSGRMSGGMSATAVASASLSEDGVPQSLDPRMMIRGARTSARSSQPGVGLGLGLGLGAGRPAAAAATPQPPNASVVSTVIASQNPLGPGEESPFDHNAASKQASRPSAASSSGGRSKHQGPIDIIVVEDVVVAQKVAQAALTRVHFKVEVAGDGEASLELFRKHRDTLKAVLMDIHLPGMSGIETAAAIRRIEQEQPNGTPPVYVYGLTGDVDEEDLVKYKQCGMNGCIQKGQLLADAVKQAMEESQAGVDFVNLCGKAGGGISAQAREVMQKHAVATATTNAINANAANIPSAASKGPILSPAVGSNSVSSTSALPDGGERLQASAVDRAKTESNVNMVGTPKAPVPRQLIADRQGMAHGTVLPGVGLHNAARMSNDRPMGIQSSAAVAAPAPAASHGPNLLLVEDVRVSQRIATTALQRAGYKVIAADNGESAVDKFRANAASLRYIIMDINLPGISGIEATENIRSIERDMAAAGTGAASRVLIFGLTGNVDAESMRNYEAAGLNGCILKGKVLADAVKQATEASAEGRFANIS